MYLADYHTHSTCSGDGKNTMTEMAQAGIEAGLDEMCVTDHVDILNWQAEQVLEHSWAPAVRQWEEARMKHGGRIKIQLGAELGQATENLERADRFLADAPPLDFIIGSLHNLSWEHGRKDFCTLKDIDEDFASKVIAQYLDEMMKLVDWGKFSVIGHFTLPLRYFNQNLGMHMTFEQFQEESAAVFSKAISKGIGIELNTNRGKLPLPDRDLLQLYHDLGGEIITVGSDAHTPEFVGCSLKNGQQLLRECGFRYFATFEHMKPVYHKL